MAAQTLIEFSPMQSGHGFNMSAVAAVVCNLTADRLMVQ
jgi:hypothetical protein